MGCSSGTLRPHGCLGPSGMALHYLHARCPLLVANLWDVTDGEIDRFTVALLKGCSASHGSAEAADEHGASVNMLSAVAVARGACRLRFLTGAAAVCYGVPLAALPRSS